MKKAAGSATPVGIVSVRVNERSNKMKTVTVLELKAKAGELVRSVVRTDEEIQITDQGIVVALLVSPECAKIKDTGKAWTTLDQLAVKIKSERNVD